MQRKAEGNFCSIGYFRIYLKETSCKTFFGHNLGTFVWNKKMVFSFKNFSIVFIFFGIFKFLVKDVFFVYFDIKIIKIV